MSVQIEPIETMAAELHRLPGVGQKTAMRWVIVFSLCLVAQNCLAERIPYVEENLGIRLPPGKQIHS